jgi:molecular chaperone GrpE (heat shock protein)
MEDDLVQRLIAVVDLLDDSIRDGERLLSGDDVPSLRHRLAAAILGPGADDNADAVAILLENCQLARKSLLQVLRQHEVDRFDAVPGVFDPGRHDCVTVRPGDPACDGQILEQRRAGYTRQGQVLRKAQVVLCRGALP